MTNTAVADQAKKPTPANLGAKKADAPKAAPAKPAAAPFKMLEVIPIPPRTSGLIGSSVYPWSDLQVGGAPFFVPGRTVKDFGGLAAATGKRMTKRQPEGATKVKFTCRSYKVDGVEGVAVWRES